MTNIYHADEFIRSDENIAFRKDLGALPWEKHGHNFIEIVYIWTGSGKQIINDRIFYVERGNMLFLNFGDYHEFYPLGEMGVINCLIQPEFISKEMVNSENAFDMLSLTSFEDFFDIRDSLHPVLKFEGRDLINIESLLDSMMLEFQEKSPGYRTALKGYLDVLLTHIFRNLKQNHMGNTHHIVSKITPEILSFIEENYNEKISLEELARRSFYNKTYFSRVFKECFGVNMSEFICARRIQQALHLLEETDLSIEKIAAMIGFNDRTHFYRVFRKKVGMTPKQFRSR